MSVRMDRHGQCADGIILFNRISSRNVFARPNESGWPKLLSIALANNGGENLAIRRGH